jgi:N-glycosylase/DNA lyase
MMVQALCREYGQSVGTHPEDGETYYDFPKLEALHHASLTKELRELGFGYRAPYIAKTCAMLAERPPDYLHELRTKPYSEVVSALQEFSGVGPKVADCVALMSLDQHAAIPVDTHVIQIAMRDYKFRPKAAPKKKGQRAPRPSTNNGKLVMNERVYGEIRDFFQQIWGEYAGWAHSVLFAADLKVLQAGAAAEALEFVIKAETEAQMAVKVEVKAEVNVKKEEVVVEGIETEVWKEDDGQIKKESGEAKVQVESPLKKLRLK